MNAYSIKVEWEEDGCHLIIDGDSPFPDYEASILDYRVEDPEALYDAVKAGVLPWLMEREEARRTRPAPLYVDDSGYDLLDPKRPDAHSIRADIYDTFREGK